DPWEDVLRNMPDQSAYRYFNDGMWHDGVRTIVYHEGGEDKVIAEHVLQYLLSIQPGNQTTQHAMRLAVTLKQLGWTRAKNGYVSIRQIGRVKGYYRTQGERPD